MKTRVTLRPGDKGTRKLQAQFGDKLICVRYRYDPKAGMRYKTVELIVDAKPYMPNKRAKRYSKIPVLNEDTDREICESVME